MMHHRWFEPWDRRDRRQVPIVLLHEGLGSISAWGTFPQSLADVTKRRVLAYDRPGYGQSEAVDDGPWPTTFMHRESRRLPELIGTEGLDEVILIGHSDGATIALLSPSQNGPAQPAVRAIVSLAAHVLVEDVCVTAIEALRGPEGDPLRARLQRHHDDAATVFERWSEVWVSDRFRHWTIDDELASVTCPVLAVQGAEDTFGTELQLRRLADGVGGPVETIELAGVDHWPHRQAKEHVLDLIRTFCDTADS